MPLTDTVNLSVSLSSSSSPTVAAFSTPLILAYHTHYPDRFRSYAGGATGLAAMLTDGFLATDPAYKAASALASQNPTVPNFAIGRRALPPTQTLTLTCVDGTVGDAYAFTIVGTDGKSHSVTYTNVVGAGTALGSSATSSVTNGSANVTYSAAQTQSHYGLIQFASQPGVYYFLNANVASSTSAVLTTNYTGVTNAATATTYTAPLSGTITVANGSAAVTTGTSQVGTVLPGDSLMFASQPGVTYTVLTVVAATITLTTPYSGTGTSTGCVDVCTAATAASSIATTLGTYTNVGTASATAAVVTITQAPGALVDIQGWLANGFQSIQLADTTADPGIATDLAAVYQANRLGWYGLILDSNSAAEIKGAQVWVEATGVGGKFLFTNNSDYANVNTNVTSDLFSSLATSGYQRMHCEQNNSQLLCYAGASNAGWVLWRNVGSYVMAQNMQKPGVTADTETTLPESWALVLNSYTAATPTNGGKFGNFYKNTQGVNASFWGIAPSGRYCDLTIGIDWLQANMQADVFAVIAGNPKIPFNDRGIGVIADAIDTRLNIAAGSAYGLIDTTLGPIVVTKPLASSFTSAQRQSRNLTGLNWTAVASNGIESVKIVGVLTQ